MAKEMEIARAVVHKFIKKGNPFSSSELYEAIREKGGIARVSIGVTIDEYLEEFERQGTLAWSFGDKKYHVIS